MLLCLLVAIFNMFCIYLQFQNIELQTVSITNVYLLWIMGAMLFGDAILMLIWTVAAPYTLSESSPLECVGSSRTMGLLVYAVYFILKFDLL